MSRKSCSGKLDKRSDAFYQIKNLLTHKLFSRELSSRELTNFEMRFPYFCTTL
jgi:hypothetical protein